MVLLSNLIKNIMEEKNMNTCEQKCNMNMQGWCCGNSYKRSLLRKFLLFLVVIMIFCVGVQFGELKGEMRSIYRHMYRQQTIDNYGNYYNKYRMMDNYIRFENKDKDTVQSPVKN